MKVKNLFKGESFNLDYFTVATNYTKNLGTYYRFALDGIGRFSIINLDLDFAYSYPKSRRDLWERDVSNLVSNSYSGLYRIGLGFRTIQEFCEVYSWFIKLGKYHVESTDVRWSLDGSRPKHQESYKLIQKRRWFTIDEIELDVNLAFNDNEIGNTDGYWWQHIDSNYPMNPRLIYSDWAGYLYIHVPIKDIISYQFRDCMISLKKELSYKCSGWSVPIEIRKDSSGYVRDRHDNEILII